LKDDVRKGGEMKKETDLNRRNFLKGSVMGAGALTAGFAGGLVLPGTADAATPPTMPLPYCRDSLGNPTNTPAATNDVSFLDPDEVRVMAYYYFSTGNG
jgi:hypothetical protein